MYERKGFEPEAQIGISTESRTNSIHPASKFPRQSSNATPETLLLDRLGWFLLWNDFLGISLGGEVHRS